MRESSEKYTKFFNSALKKYGVNSPAELDGEKKKDFFNYVDNNYSAKNESTDAYAKALTAITKDRKMDMISKKDKQTLIKIAKMMKKANEIREDKEAYTKFFNSALEKFGVSSPAELEDDKKKEFFNYIDDNYKSANEAKGKGLWANIHAKRKRGEKPAKPGDKDYPETLDIENIEHSKLQEKWEQSWIKSPFYKKLSKFQRQAVDIALIMGGNMTGAVKAIEKIKKGLSKDKKVVKALRLFNESKINEREAIGKANDMMKHLDNAHSFYLKFSHELRKITPNIAMRDKKDFDIDMKYLRRDAMKTMDKAEKAIKSAKKLGILEASDVRIKTDAYQNAMKALDKYIDTMKELGIKKKSQTALGLLKKLQSSFFAKEGVNEVGNPLVQKLDHAIQDVQALLQVAKSPEASDAYSRPKPSKKALIASLKLLNKVD